ncbi:MAG: hypothetical protein H9W80_02265 [Enterococcus sp.]|nr:hypothetical protein [Enterococcus sp.]
MEISEVQKATKLGFDLTDYFNKVYEVDKGQSTTNPHILAARIINNNDPITPEHVNDITNILYPGKITQAELDSFSTASWNKFPCPLTEADKQNLYDFLGSHRKEGLYGFFLKSDGSPLYIGSSVNLPQRVRQYILPSKYHLIKGLIGEFVRGDNLHTAELRIMPLPQNVSSDLLIHSEQYMFFTMNPSLNIVKVAGSGGQTLLSEEALLKQITQRGETVYAYNMESKKYLGEFPSMRRAAEHFDINLKTLQYAVRNNRVSQGIYFSMTPVNNLSVVEVQILDQKALDKAVADDKRRQAGKKVSRPLYIYNDARTELLHEFPTVTSAIKQMGANNSSVYSALKKDTSYKNLYLSYDKLPGVESNLVSLVQLKSMMRV